MITDKCLSLVYMWKLCKLGMLLSPFNERSGWIKQSNLIKEIKYCYSVNGDNEMEDSYVPLHYQRTKKSDLIA